MTGSNYNSSFTTKEIAKRVREYVKKNFPGYKFSVRTALHGSCDVISVEMKSTPVEVYKTTDEMTWEDVAKSICRAMRYNCWTLDDYTEEEARAELERLYRDGRLTRCINEEVAATAAAVDEYVSSYNSDDSDPMTDYFDSFFYYFGCLDSIRA